MKINADKFKMLNKDPRHLSVDETDLEKVDSFVFLGSLISKTSEDMKRRITLAERYMVQKKHREKKN